MPIKPTETEQGKKIIAYSQYLGLGFSIAGSAFKLMHWPGANMMLIQGIGTLAMVSFIKYAFEGTLEALLLGSAIALGLIGVLFKLMHWPHDEQIIAVAVVAGVAWALKSFLGGKKEEQ